MKFRFLAFCASLLCLSVGSAFGQVTSNQIYAGLISYWPMDQLMTNVSGVVTTPDVVSGLNLTATGGVTVGSGGEFGNAITLNGTTGFLSSTNNSLAVPTNNLANGLPYYDGQPLTITMWIKAAQPSSTTHYLFAMGSTTNANILYLVQSGSATTTESNLDCIIRNQNGTAVVSHPHSTNALFNATATWHHLAWVDSNGVVSVYQDGVLEAQSMVFSYFPTSLVNPNAESTSGTYLVAMPINTFALGALVRGGSSAPSGFLAGTFDDVAVWDRALSQAEVQYVMTNSIAQPVPALAPSFAAPWTGQTNSMGDYVILNANAVGTPPLNLQWYENGAAISGATNETLDLPAYNNTMTISGTNVLYVVASNSIGVVTNGPANLVVLPDPAPELTNGCFGYWPLDTVTNVTATNATTPDIYSVNNLNLTNITTANLVPGVFSNALSFNAGSAQNAYLDGITPAFNLTNYTISFWINASPGPNGQYNDFLFDNASSLSSTPVLGFCSPQSASGPTTNLCVFLRSDQSVGSIPDVLSSNSVLDGTWHHVTWVDKAGSVTLYVDGAIDPVSFSYTRTNATPTLRSNITWTLNSEALAALWRSKSGADRLTCEMDDVAWWARALSYTEVQMLQTNSVPTPTLLTPPMITGLNSIPNAYVGDTDTFSAIVTGSPIISYQWFRSAASNYSGTAIQAANNATATNSALTLVNVQVTNSGYYYLVASNGAAPGSGLSGGGVFTSAVVQLVVSAYLAPPTNANQTVLQLEFNAAATPTNVYPGFLSMTLTNPSLVLNGTTKVTISPIGGAVLADRDRNASAEPDTVTNDPPALTTALLYNSFIFDDVETAGTGIDVFISHLATNTQYQVILWSFDPESSPARYSDWTEAISGTVIASPYSFNGANQPTANYGDTMNVLLTSSTNGQLDIQGVIDPLSVNSELGVFINALTIIANPTPSITTNSPSITNAYASDTETFSVTAVGSQPLSYQWYYDGVAISSANNSTATNGTLILTDVQTNNDGSYYLVISNPFGMVTSAVVQLEVTGFYLPPPANVNQVVLPLEFNAVATPTNVQPGFQSMTLAEPSAVFNNTTRVTISPLNGAVLADRDRNASAEPDTVTNDPPELTTALLYNSFIFDNFENGTTSTGINVLIQHLASNTLYGVNIWSFDPDSSPLRVSDWTETNSGATIMYQYAFNGANQPETNYDDTFGALLMSSPSGQLDIQGLADPSYLANYEVFLNAIVITANPVPQILSSAINPADGNLLIVAQAQYSGQSSIVFQESPDLINWQNATDGLNATENGPIYTSEFPLSAKQMFYRVVYQ
jgi:hypothetical protein